MGKSASLADIGSISDTQLAFRNKIINGNFDFWQRGTADGSTDSAGYLADRFARSRTGSTLSQSRQAFALGQTDVPGEPSFYWQGIVTSSAGSSNYALLNQAIESVKTLAGQSAVLTFYAKADASRNIAVEFSQVFGSGGSPSATVDAQGVTTCALTTSWQKFTVPVTFASISGKTIGTAGDDKVYASFWFDAGSTYNSRTNSLGQQSGTFSIARVQLEPGTKATAFEDRPKQTELALCQRYYEVSGDYWEFGCTSNTFTGSDRYIVQKRATPTLTFFDTSGNVNRVTLEATPNVALSAGAIATRGAFYVGARASVSGATTASYVRFGWTASAEL